MADDRVEEFALACSNPENWRVMTDLCRDENGEREDEIGQIPQPTLLVWGDDDLAYPVDFYGRRFEREIGDARLVVVERCGHYPPEERPQAFAEILASFLRETE